MRGKKKSSRAGVPGRSQRRFPTALAVVAGVAALLTTACTDPDGARKTLEGAGYTNITTGGYAAWSCSDDDNYATEFTATGPTGLPVKGAVCRGLWMKNATIRFE